ncbi:DoxX family membrane protein [Isoptericola sp. AK164]|uniref:DoxX family membrane protein n=1 Tax=Isoptericola sp. AK164 TaxID=3024246 RepID=UPI002418465C|nr:DoxX family membrane protein [Isoptericola sp. AK164]
MLLRRLARPLLAVPFVYDGVSTALRPAEHTEAARRGADTVTEALGVEPLDDTQVSLLVRAHGGATALAGLLLAVGRTPRSAALTLAALTAPLAVVNQPFTSKGDERRERTDKFVKNLGAIGAAVIAGIDLEGRPGVSYRIAQKRAAASKSAHHAVESASTSGKHAVENLERSGKHAVANAKRSATYARRSASASARHATQQVERELRSTAKNAKASAKSAKATAKSARASAEKAAAKAAAKVS